MGADGQITQRDRAEGGPSQTHDRMPQGVAVAFHLVLAALGEGQTQPRGGRAGPEKLHGQRRRRTVVEPHAGSPPRERRARDRPLDLGLVDPRDAVSRMEQPMGQRAVVGEEQRALDVDVEAPHRVEPRRGGDEVGDDGAALGIVTRGHVAGGLVEQHVLLGLGGADAAAVQPDLVDVEVGERPGLADDGAVDGDPTRENEDVSSPA